MDQQRSFKPFRIWFYFAFVLLIAMLLFTLWRQYETRLETLPVYGEKTMENGQLVEHTIPSFELTDQDGNAFSRSTLDGQIAVVNYFFTACPGICPSMTNNLTNAQDRFSDDAGVSLVSITVDPKRDNPDRLKQYAAEYGINTDQWHFLTGDKKHLYWLARKGFYLSATDGDGGPLDFIHSENAALLDRRGRIRGYYDVTDPNKVDQLIRDIYRLKKEKS